ncbi:hypothetical protein [Paracoccus xiamenensis]|uniref:hypothetical protein n=1 Tax=Paracoccus xiamenensis TaxID=2714901 RepID=UPI00140D723D|nr:hypothetical protein [Paracoccus xiamenensis]NHF73194.1 hypothetical protein [Paracoccus xiamenensis]
MSLPALLLLTLMSDGDTRLTLSPADSAQACAATREVLVQVLIEAGKPPLLALCGTSALQLSPYVHGVPPEAETHRYRVEIPSSGGFSVTPLAAQTPCAPVPDADPVVHCTRSSQRVLSDD